jgi:HSP20 family protein
MGLLKHETKEVKPVVVPASLDKVFEDWMTFPFRWSFGAWTGDDVIRVDQYRENGTLVIKAEMPGIDPDKDVELTIEGGVLQIEAERREEETTDEKGYVTKELRYGRFSRTLLLPEGVSEADIKATYKDGILEVRVPTPEPRPATRIEVSKA